MNDLDTADPNIQSAILEAMSEGVSAGVLLYDKNDQIVFASQQFASLLSVAKDLLSPGTRLRDLLVAIHDAGIHLGADAHGQRRSLSREDWLAEQISGMWKERAEALECVRQDRWLRVTKRRMPSGYGVCVVKDVSEQKRREDQWRLDTERVQITEEVLDNLPFPISVKDGNGTFVAINRANCDFLDLNADAILGNSGSDINPPALEERLGPINREVYETGIPVDLPERIIRPDGSTAIVVVHKYRVGKPGRYYLVTLKQDVSALVAQEGDGQPLVPRIREEDLVEIDLTRREIPASPKPHVQADLADAKILVVAASLDTEARAVAILGEQGADVSAVSGPDELALFLQLASESDVRIDLVVVDTRMRSDCVQVADAHGTPVLRIDPLILERDLPLFVSAELKRASEEMVVSPSEDWHPGTPENDRQIDILVAEDNEVNQIVFSQIIESFGYRYALAVDGEEAVRLWREHSPRLVLMDVTLPKLTGFEASAAIRALEGNSSPVPIVGVLAQAFDRDRESCFGAGMDDVILKPISPEALDAVFRRFLTDGDDVSEPVELAAS
ncbi:PAS domain S-box-containing protein [Rhizobium sp. NFR07]|uniref:response regulator n=1 Tax=Rhizobium sp. NFR07 TaxID=1566262 RepID=UPI0008F2BB49|nr:response regulator [Rhizobium sp. NFR07]SFB07888.1 PAS domain S-box-containing protein [Rhizobium sp. NFR07]